MFENHFFLAKVSDNKDPDGLNRINVTYQNENEVVTNWIPYMTSFAGDSTGISVLPNVDEQVLVISLDIQKSKLVAIGSIWSEAAQPPETGENGDADLNQDGKNSLTFIKTKSENMLIFDDTDGKEKIQIIDSKTNSRIEFIDVQHLHLELLYCKTGMELKAHRDKVLDMTYNQLHENDGGVKGQNKAYLRFATGDDTIWKLQDYGDWKEYRLNPLTGEKN